MGFVATMIVDFATRLSFFETIFPKAGENRLRANLGNAAAAQSQIQTLG